MLYKKSDRAEVRGGQRRGTTSSVPGSTIFVTNCEYNEVHSKSKYNKCYLKLAILLLFAFM